MIETAFLALGLVLIVEGLAYVLAPLFIERLLEALRMLGEDQRRMVGLIAMAIGLCFVCIAKNFGA